MVVLNIYFIFLGGRTEISEPLKQDISNFLELNSRQASNRVVKHDNEEIPVRYLNETQKEIWKKSPFKNLICERTFYNYKNIKNQFKKAFRLTDLCDYCLWAKNIKKIILSKVSSIEGVRFNSEFNVQNLVKLFEEKARASTENTQIDEYRVFIKQLLDYELIGEHAKMATIQRESYNFQRKSVEILRNNILIEADFKQSIAIGLSPEQANSEYYKQSYKKLLGKIETIL
jgi:hypothetical protein